MSPDPTRGLSVGLKGFRSHCIKGTCSVICLPHQTNVIKSCRLNTVEITHPSQEKSAPCKVAYRYSKKFTNETFYFAQNKHEMHLN